MEKKKSASKKKKTLEEMANFHKMSDFTTAGSDPSIDMESFKIFLNTKNSSPEERLEIMKTTNFLADKVPFVLFDRIVALTIYIPDVRKAHNIPKGALTKDGKRLLNSKLNWNGMKKEYSDLLYRVMKETIDREGLDESTFTFGQVKDMELSIRMKKLRGFQSVFYHYALSSKFAAVGRDQASSPIGRRIERDEKRHEKEWVR